MLFGTTLSPVAFARAAGISYSMLSKVRRGIRKFDPETCIQIEERTGGVISAKFLRPDIFDRSHMAPPGTGSVEQKAMDGKSLEKEIPQESDFLGA